MGYSSVHAPAPLRRLIAGTVLVALLVWASAASALDKVVHYRGHTIHVPRGWPVFDLAAHPSTCVRFDRHAVYLGTPSAAQRCPATAVGHAKAILVEPNGKLVTGWSPTVTRSRASAAAVAHTASRARAAGATYTGLGFDVCSAPNERQMAAWSSTSYHAVGIYIGGANSACAQPNLTPTWVSDETAAGWSLIPTYVGLQAPGACGCATISTSGGAAKQGTSAANDAVTQAQALGIGPGNPIYFDMEAYPRGGTTTTAVLAFLQAWTSQLHLAGYLSGVYSSGLSGITDLVSRYGTTYIEPDDLWIADWNGQKTTSDPYVPATEWANHQRLHQYSGGHNETHGGVTLNIDGDYLDGSIVGGVTPPAATPSLSAKPSVDGSVKLQTSWTGIPNIASWQILSGSNPAALASLGVPVPGGAASSITVHSQFAYFGAQALDSTGAVLGTTPAVAVAPHLAIFGRSAFVPSRGLTGIPVGCFTGTTCHVTTTLTSGRTVVGTGGRQYVGSPGGIVFVKLSSAGRTLLSKAPGRRLPVQVTATDSSGVRAKTTLKLTPFTTSGKAPVRRLSPSPTLKLLGATDFVYRNVVGGILASCPSAVPCSVTTTISAGRTTIATAGPQFLGANELGYLSFKLTSRGRSMLAATKTNQLGVRVRLNDGAATATGRIVLVGFR